MTPFWDDHLSLTKSIEPLCFYINKYLPAGSGIEPAGLPTSAWLSGLYLRHYRSALARRFVALCGYPEIVANRIWGTKDGQMAMRALSAHLITLARSGHSARRPYNDEMQINTVFGDYNLPKILKKMTIPDSASGSEPALAVLIADHELRNAFIEQYRVVEKMMYTEARKQGVPASSFARLVAINCNKASRNIPFLFRNVIFRECRRLAEEHPDLATLRHQTELMIQPVIDEARVLYQTASDFKTLLWCLGKMTLEYDARSNCLNADIAGKKTELSCIWGSGHPELSTDVAHLLSSMHTYWGNTYKEIMQ
jgi:hypothetical protein